MPGNLDRASLARCVDHTLLRPEATLADVEALCAEAGRLGVRTVCISPSFLPLEPGLLPSGVGLCVVAGFPSGAHQPAVKAYEAERAVQQGAAEVDMVVNLGHVLTGQWVAVEREIAGVRRVVGSAVLKVILESALLDEACLAQACRVAVAAGADFVKTSTGFHPAGGATVEAVRIMREAVGDRAGVKASGGIRTADVALAMLAAGATRLGMSATAAVLDGLATSPR